MFSGIYTKTHTADSYFKATLQENGNYDVVQTGGIEGDFDDYVSLKPKTRSYN